MAGSYHHCIDEKTGEFVGEDFTNMIDNLGDAYEACEQMVFMINFLANGDKKLIEKALKSFYKCVK